MVNIRTLAPTLTDALHAIELGCRKVQDDPHFQPNMSKWLVLLPNGICMGCLATCTLMQLANKTGKDILEQYAPGALTTAKEITDRSAAFQIEEGRSKSQSSEFASFECAIDSLRHGEIYPLLEFYGLHKHRHTRTIEHWLIDNLTRSVGYNGMKQELLDYADFLKDKLIPKIQELFPPTESD